MFTEVGAITVLLASNLPCVFVPILNFVYPFSHSLRLHFAGLLRPARPRWATDNAGCQCVVFVGRTMKHHFADTPSLLSYWYILLLSSQRRLLGCRVRRSATRLFISRGMPLFLICGLAFFFLFNADLWQEISIVSRGQDVRPVRSIETSVCGATTVVVS
jgi:hypothetical protein